MDDKKKEEHLFVIIVLLAVSLICTILGPFWYWAINGMSHDVGQAWGATAAVLIILLVAVCVIREDMVNERKRKG